MPSQTNLSRGSSLSSALSACDAAQRQQAQTRMAPELVAEDGQAGGITAQEGQLVARADDVVERRARRVVDRVVDGLGADQQGELAGVLRRVEGDVDVLRLDVDLVGVEATALVLLHGIGRAAPEVVHLELGAEAGQAIHEERAVFDDGNPALLDVEGLSVLHAHRAAREVADGPQRHAACRPAGSPSWLVARDAGEEVVDEDELARLGVLRRDPWPRATRRRPRAAGCSGPTREARARPSPGPAPARTLAPPSCLSMSGTTATSYASRLRRG